MDPTIAAAVIAALGVIISTWLANRKTRRGVTAVHDEVRTNHGKRAGEYLENVDALLTLFAEHTAQDERNFNELRRGMDALSAKVSAAW
jgi:hypothetical protein